MTMTMTRSFSPVLTLQYLSLFLLATLNFPASATTYVHRAPGVIRGHFLHPGGDGATQFELAHRLPLLLWGELHDDGVRLLSAVPSSSDNSVALHLSGDVLDVTDFTTFPSTVLSIPAGELSLHGVHLPTDVGAAVHLSVTDVINDADTNTVVVHAAPLAEQGLKAVTHARFRPRTARLHPRAGPTVSRRVHVYGRHSRHPGTLSGSETGSGNAVEMVQGGARQSFFGIDLENPFTVCFVSTQANQPAISGLLEAIGFEPETVCDLQLSGLIVSENLSTSTSASSTNAPLKVRPFARGLPSPSMDVNVTMIIDGTGTFNVTSDMLNFTFNYHGSISAEYDCPGGCVAPLAAGEWVVPNYHTLVKTPQGYGVPELDEFRFNSDVTVRWNSKFFARANTSLKVRQPFNVSTTVRPGQPPISASVPTPDDATDITMMGPLPDGSFNGPWGQFSVDVGVRTKFRDTGTVIANAVKFETGFRVSAFKRGGKGIFGPKKWGTNKGQCGECHKRRVSIKPILRNVSAVMETTDLSLGWDDIDTGVTNPPAGKPLTFCALPTTCPMAG